MKEQKVLLIIGAGSDIGKAIAREFAKHHYAIQLAGRNMGRLKKLRQDLISRFDTDVAVCFFDAAEFENHQLLLSYFPQHPDLVVYVAGCMNSQEEAQYDWNKARNMIDVNYSGAVSVLNIYARLFNDRKSGCIVGISSVAGDRGRGSNYIYGSTKAAFSAYLSGLRNSSYKNKVRVISVKPGFVYTKMTQHLSLPGLLTAYPDRVAKRIYKAISNKKDVIYIKSAWFWIMNIIKVIPEPIFKRMNL